MVVQRERKEKSLIAYNESLPYFSAIIEMLVYSKHLEDLQKAEKELQPLPITVEKNVKEPSPINIVGKNNPFNSQLNDSQIILLADCVNEAHIFTTQITAQILEDFFYCRLSGDLRSANNRLLAYFMVELNLNKFITNEWQSVIANNRLILAPTKDRYLNRSDLSTATENIKFKPPIGSEIIDKYIKQLKKD